MKKLKVYSIYTHETVVLRDIFLHSLKDDWEISMKYWEEPVGDGGNWGSPGFVKLLRNRIKYLIGLIKENFGNIIIWSDVDIQFFNSCTPLINERMEVNDILFQSECWPQKEINGGFAVIRCNQSTLSLYEMVLKADLENLPFIDQSAINTILKDNIVDVKWDILPKQFWAMSHQLAPTRDIVMHHANCTYPTLRGGIKIGSIQLKLEQMELVRDYVTSIYN